jgi:exopolyphosphatase/guanosine-5'-triphosphate,3'-diphosphate pyrophosphatase
LTPNPDIVAAVDLGSNSFHMVVARVLPGGQFQFLDRLKDPVRLAAGLNARGELKAGAQRRALEALRRFGQRLRELPPGSVRAVGTNTLRKARNARTFLDQAARALGHPVEVISGREEARLIWLGVCREIEAPGRRLVLDVGGGSTELIVGEGPTPELLDSLYMGCVSWSLRFFPDGQLRREAMRRAITAAHLELESLEERYRRLDWARAIGCSGTILAIERILTEAGWSPAGITAAGVAQLRKAMIEAGKVEKLRLPGLAADRRAVLAGGVAIVSAVLEALRIRHLETSPSALREGVLVDLLGRFRHEDVREQTVDALAQRYQVDNAQAERVQATALLLFDQVAGAWRLDAETDRELLSRAARLHEVGLFVAWSGYHKHGAYLLSHADLPGFSRQEQEALAGLVLAHRGRLDEERLREYCPTPPGSLPALSVLLRLAARLHRSRASAPLPPLRAEASEQALALHFPEGALAHRPLTRADLAEEAEALAAAGFSLSCR